MDKKIDKGLPKTYYDQGYALMTSHASHLAGSIIASTDNSPPISTSDDSSTFRQKIESGIMSLSCIHAMFVSGLDCFVELEDYDGALEIMKDYSETLNGHYMVEKMSDDDATDPNKKQEVLDFNDRVVRALNLLDGDFNGLPPSYALNLRTAVDVDRMFDTLAKAANLPGIQQIRRFAKYGQRMRYVSSSISISEPNMSVDRAIQNGRYTILTDTFASYALVLAQISLECGDGSLAERIDAHAGKIIEAVTAMSYLIRIQNDIGLLAIPSTLPAELIDNLRARFGLNLSPRELFLELGRSKKAADEALKDYFASLIKDSTEGDQNIAFDSGRDGEMSVDKEWELLLKNLDYLSAFYVMRLEAFLLNVDVLTEQTPALASFLIRFLDANLQLYSLHGEDYDEGKAWLGFRAMLWSFEAIRVFHKQFLI